jgi:hypothetical protein
MSTRITLGPTISSEVASLALPQAKMHLNDDFEIEAASPVTTQFIDPIYLQSASLVVSIISLVLVFRRDFFVTQKPWGADQITAFLRSELLRVGTVQDFTLKSISGLNNLSSDGVCKICLQLQDEDRERCFAIQHSGYDFILNSINR